MDEPVVDEPAPEGLMMDPADELVVVRCQLGERAAFAQLVARWHWPLWTFLRRMVGDPGRSDDLSQEVWVRVVRGPPRLRSPDRFPAWLFTLARRVAEIAALVDAELSRSDRFRYVARAPAGAAASALIAALWLTEQSLPLRTHLAFAGLCGLGLAWVAVSAYVLTRRRPLYGTDRVLASGLAVLASAAFGLGAVVIAAQRGGGDDALTLGFGAGTLLTLAVVLHLRDRRRRRRLLARRRELEADG